MATKDARFSSTVPRELVHRSAVTEVYLTGMEQIESDRFAVFAQWPRRHYFYEVDDGQVEAAMIIETFRQATVYIAHRGYEVDLGSYFLLPELHLTRLAPSRNNPLQPANVTLYCSATDLRLSGGALTFMNVSAEISVGDYIIAKVEAGARMVTGAAYARYRGRRPATEGPFPRHSGASRQLIGRTSDTSVLLGAPLGPQQWQLNVDLSDPVFFDHYVDHIPGVALLEAARQTIAIATKVPRIDFHGVSATFHAMVELDIPARVSAHAVELFDDLYDRWIIEITTGDVLNTTIVALCNRSGVTTGRWQLNESDQKNQLTSLADVHS